MLFVEFIIFYFLPPLSQQEAVVLKLRTAVVCSVVTRWYRAPELILTRQYDNSSNITRPVLRLLLPCFWLLRCTAYVIRVQLTYA